MIHLLRNIVFIGVISFLISCSINKKYEKGFQTVIPENAESDDQAEGLGLSFEIRPGNVILTGNTDIRLTTLYKVNYNKDKSKAFIGEHRYHYNEVYEYPPGQNWNQHIVPGFQTIYGFNMVNLSIYQLSQDKAHNLFENPVLIKNVYYPSEQIDTLNYKPVKRNYYMVSAYSDDTNKDGFINTRDLRRMFLFDENGKFLKKLIPDNQSPFKSEYDAGNDLLFVFCKVDSNSNGTIEINESTSVYWIDLKDPLKSSKIY